MINLVHPSVLTALQSIAGVYIHLVWGGNAMHMARTYDMHLQHAWVYHNGQDVKKYQGVKNRFNDTDAPSRYHILKVLQLNIRF